MFVKLLVQTGPPPFGLLLIGLPRIGLPPIGLPPIEIPPFGLILFGLPPFWTTPIWTNLKDKGGYQQVLLKRGLITQPLILEAEVSAE